MIQRIKLFFKKLLGRYDPLKDPLHSRMAQAFERSFEYENEGMRAEIARARETRTSIFVISGEEAKRFDEKYGHLFEVRELGAWKSTDDNTLPDPNQDSSE